MKKYGYARVSSQGQNLDRQIDELSRYVQPELIFKDKMSGKDMERLGYQYLRAVADRGDEVYFKSLDRLGRNKQTIREELEYFRNKGVIVRILDIPTTLQAMDEFGSSELQRAILEMINNVLIEVMGTMAEQERKTIRQRQREGIDAARIRGKHLGRPKAVYPANWSEVYVRWKQKELTAKEAMRLLSLKRTTFYKLARQSN